MTSTYHYYDGFARRTKILLERENRAHLREQCYDCHLTTLISLWSSTLLKIIHQNRYSHHHLDWFQRSDYLLEVFLFAIGWAKVWLLKRRSAISWLSKLYWSPQSSRLVNSRRPSVACSAYNTRLNTNRSAPGFWYTHLYFNTLTQTAILRLTHLYPAPLTAMFFVSFACKDGRPWSCLACCTSRWQPRLQFRFSE